MATVTRPLRRQRLIACGILLAAVLLLIFFWLKADSSHLQFWLQLFTGNWAPAENYLQITPLEFAFTALFAIVLNWTPLIGAFVLIYKHLRLSLLGSIAAERRKTVLLKQAFDAREEATKSVLRRLLVNQPEIRNQLDNVFVEGEKVAKRHLVAAFGERETEDFLNSLNQEVSQEPAFEYFPR